MTSIFVSIVASWRFVDDQNRTTVTSNHLHRREELAALSGGQARNDGFALPWPPFRSKFWERTMNKTPWAVPSADVLGRLLVPMRALVGVNVFDDRIRGRPLAEVYYVPFGLWTTLSLEVHGEWADPATPATDLRTVMRLPIVRSGHPVGDVEGGITANLLADVLDVPWQGLTMEPTGSLTITSGLCAEDDTYTDRAEQFRSQFLGGTGATTHMSTRSATATATTSSQIGLALADTGGRPTARIKCLHHNYSVLAGHLLTQGALVRSAVTASADTYRNWAAEYLNHLYRREPLRGAGIYKSSVGQAWLDHTGLPTAIDARTKLLPRNPPPPLVQRPPKEQ